MNIVVNIHGNHNRVDVADVKGAIVEGLASGSNVGVSYKEIIEGVAKVMTVVTSNPQLIAGAFAALYHGALPVPILRPIDDAVASTEIVQCIEIEENL